MFPLYHCRYRYASNVSLDNNNFHVLVSFCLYGSTASKNWRVETNSREKNPLCVMISIHTVCYLQINQLAWKKYQRATILIMKKTFFCVRDWTKFPDSRKLHYFFFKWTSKKWKENSDVPVRRVFSKAAVCFPEFEVLETGMFNLYCDQISSWKNVFFKEKRPCSNFEAGNVHKKVIEIKLLRFVKKWKCEARFLMFCAWCLL